MKKYFLITWMVSFGFFLTTMSAFAADDFGINVKAGTLGLGAELSKAFSDKLSLNLGFNSYNYKTTRSESGIDYDSKFELQSASLLANYHPFSGLFRFTAGALYNGSELKLTGKPSAGSSYSINGVTYTAAQVGALTGTVTFNKTAPYVGVGWGNRPGSKLGLCADVGLLYQGSPKLALSATGNAAGLATNLEQERKNAEADLNNFKWYPVLSLGVYFRF